MLPRNTDDSSNDGIYVRNDACSVVTAPSIRSAGRCSQWLMSASEVCVLKPGDVDRQRMVFRIEQGTGREDRYALMPPTLLEQPCAWPRAAHAPGSAMSAARSWLMSAKNQMKGDDGHTIVVEALSRSLHPSCTHLASTSDVTRHLS